MNEIEKLYENAGIKNYRLHSFVGFVPNGYKAVCYEDNPNKVKEVVREFTAEKQIELIKWLADTDNYIKAICRMIDTRRYCIKTIYKNISMANNFEEALAGLINNLWQSLTEEERKQIKEILQ